MVAFVKKHTLLSIYSFIFCILFYGVVETSGSLHIFSLMLYFISFLTSYFLLFNRILNFNFDIKKILPNSLIKIDYLILFSLLLIISHFIYLGYIPVIKALSLNDIDEIVWVRTNITINNNTFYNYTSSILIRAILPFILLLLLTKKRYSSFYILSIIFSFYAFSLMQKSYIITLVLPSLIYAIYSRKILLSLFNIFLIGGIVLGLGYVSNPNLNPAKNKQIDLNLDQLKKNKSNMSRSSIHILALGIKNRVLVVPGKMVSNWFKNVPSKIPHSGINGYRIIAKLKNIEPIAYDEELYPIISKKFYDRGLRGTVNVASFMYEYAYFGKKGLVLSAILLSILFIFIEKVFVGNFIMKLTLNIYPILILSSSALTTSLLSGGWVFIIILYLIFKNDQTKLKTA